MSAANVVASTITSLPFVSAARYISPDTVEAVKAVSIVDVAGPIISLRRSGNRFIGKCPFHDEKTPSFSVDPAKGLFYCFGCSAGGDVIEFVKRIEGCEFPEAVKILARRFGIGLKDGAVDHKVLALRKELLEVERGIDEILTKEQIWCADELQSLRLILRTQSGENLPANIYDRLRRADARYVLVSLTTRSQALEFLRSSPTEQADRVDAALEDGYVRGDRNSVWEVPCQ